MELVSARDAVQARVRERLDTIRRQKIRWKADYPSFAADGLKIQPKDPLTDLAVGGLRSFIFNRPQHLVHEQLENQRAELGYVRALVLKARQMGMSTKIQGRFYHRMKYWPGFRGLTMTHRDDASSHLLGMLQTYIENDPDPPGLKQDNADIIEFENGSSMMPAIAGTQKTGTGRSFTYQLAHLSEVAFWNQAGEHMNAVLRTIPRAPHTEVILESTANGASGAFYAMCMAAQAGIGEYILIFVPWYEHLEYQMPPPPGWRPGAIVEELRQYSLSEAQLYWAETEATGIAATDHEPLDEIPWRFKQEFPSTVEEAFRAGRKGGYIKASVVQAARRRTNPHQGELPLIFGCDFACGGGGSAAEYTSAEQLSGRPADAHNEDAEGGDANCFMSHRGRCKGRELYDRFRERDTIAVANRLQAAIERLNPDRVFMDSGGGGAQVFDILCDRGYGAPLELVNFAASSPDPTCRNMRSFMHKQFREWLHDGGDIPDDDLLETEITAAWVTREEPSLQLAPKREIRQRLKISPDGSDSAILCHAAPVRKRGGSIVIGGH